MATTEAFQAMDSAGDPEESNQALEKKKLSDATRKKRSKQQKRGAEGFEKQESTIYPNKPKWVSVPEKGGNNFDLVKRPVKRSHRENNPVWRGKNLNKNFKSHGVKLCQ